MSLNFLSQLTGSFAMPAAENPTVAMIEAAYKHHGLDWRYLNCEVSPENLGDAVRGARAMGWAGFNCSIPHKVSVIQYLDEIGESAHIIGAVNTIVNKGNRLVGENTDGKGFLQSMQEVIDPVGKSIVLFGAGGAARAVSVELALAGVKSITVVNRTQQRARVLVGLLIEKTPTSAKFVHWSNNYAIPEGTDIVINTTSIGLYPDVDERLNIDFDSLTPDQVVADVIPNPPHTHLIREAESRGGRVIDGLGILVNQGVIAIKYWAGVDVNPLVMRNALNKIFA